MDEREAKLKEAVERTAPSLLPFVEEILEARRKRRDSSDAFYRKMIVAFIAGVLFGAWKW